MTTEQQNPQEVVDPEFAEFWRRKTIAETEDLRTQEQGIAEAAKRQAKSFFYGAILDPAQRLKYVFERGADELGIPGFHEPAKELAARIQEREGRFRTPETQYYSVASPFGLVGMKGGAYLLSKIPTLSKIPILPEMAGGAVVGGATAPVDPNSPYYWPDVRTQAVTGGLFAPLAGAFGRTLSPNVTNEGGYLLSQGVKVPSYLVTEGHTQDALNALRMIRNMFSKAHSNDETLMNATFNRAIANDVLKPLGIKVTSTDPQTIYREMSKGISKFYDDAYLKLGTALPSPRLVYDVSTIRDQAAHRMNPATLRVFNDYIDRNLIGRFNIPTQGQGKATTGESIKDMRAYFRDVVKSLDEAKFNKDVDVLALKKHLDEVRKSVDRYTDEIDPTGLVKTANQAWAEMNVIKSAMAKHPSGRPFTAQDLGKAVIGGSDESALAWGGGTLQKKARPYLNVLDPEGRPTGSGWRWLGAGSIALGSSYIGWLQNPAIGIAILTAAGVAPKVIDKMIQTPNRYIKGLGAAVRKLGPGQAAQVMANTGQISQEEARKLIEAFPRQ